MSETIGSTGITDVSPSAAPAGGPRPSGAARTVATDAVKRDEGLDVGSLVLVAVLLAAGAILKLTLGNVLTFAGMKPNFVIAMYCVAILLVRPKPLQGLVIGLIAGCICQIPMLNSTPWLNIPSEMLGALVMSLLVMVPMRVGKVDANPTVATFLSTVVSGYAFVLMLAAINGMDVLAAIVTYVPMVFGTALFNCVLATILVAPLRKVLKR